MAASLVGCGDYSSSNDQTTTAAQKSGPIPASLRTIESASEDIIDLALAGKRAEAVKRAKELDLAARGPARLALEKVRLSSTARNLASRAARVARLAPHAPLLDVAIASNQTFQLMALVFDQYETPVPSQVTWLDYIEFQAKLQSKARDSKRLHVAVVALRRNWDTLRPDVTDPQVARRFSAHVKSLTRLADNANPEKTQREAQHGLDLVDELERAFSNASSGAEGSEEEEG